MVVYDFNNLTEVSDKLEINSNYDDNDEKQDELKISGNVSKKKLGHPKNLLLSTIFQTFFLYYELKFKHIQLFKL
ncbi:hypothetical protein RhiirA1_478105 [Rhizophagus irregularis]|uniref:Uncharacterized protein n=1 Tax=Rhizophagus irregularis TaxID=588596 RepID=A0A2N0QSL7_9GLOM|nr:hypothetical protein RhiirA1_478105 [Rhizophagus irregularis]